MLASDNVFIIGRQQEKDKDTDKNISGYNFTLTVEKSRYVKEKSKFDVTVKFNGGILRWSGMFDLALEYGAIHKINNQSYCLVDMSTGEVLDGEKFKKKELENNGAVFKKILEETKFADFIKEKYAVSFGDLISDDVEDDVEDIDSILDEE